jgi:murein DD-endopeptidase MepM/ murein hydrolase activator NlpD
VAEASAWSWPLPIPVTLDRRFEPPRTAWGAGHRGVDLAGAPAAAVRTALAGTVTFAGRIAGRGVVVVSHGRVRTTYEPVAAVVTIGDQVSGGAVIGRLELSGSHCFPGWCLHWGLIEGRDHYLDPLTLVGATPVRLLPLGEAAG